MPSTGCASEVTRTAAAAVPSEPDQDDTVTPVEKGRCSDDGNPHCPPDER